MAHNVPMLCAFLLIRPCCRQLHRAGSFMQRYLLKWEGKRGRERESTGLIYCLCRGESERGGVQSEKEKRDSFFDSLELSEIGWSLSPSEGGIQMNEEVLIFLPPHLQETFPKLCFSASTAGYRFFCAPLLGTCYRPHLTAAQQKPLGSYPACLSVCREICLDAFLAVEGEPLPLCWNPAVLLSPVWVQTQLWEFQDSLCAAFPTLFLCVCLHRELA